MRKYRVYINAGIEIWDEVEAESIAQARHMAHDLIGHRTYQCDMEIEDITDDHGRMGKTMEHTAGSP